MRKKIESRSVSVYLRKILLSLKRLRHENSYRNLRKKVKVEIQKYRSNNQDMISNLVSYVKGKLKTITESTRKKIVEKNYVSEKIWA